MRITEIECWALNTIERVEKHQPIEDDIVELKSKWPDDYYKTARRIAAHANSSRGEPILWLIGIDEKDGVVGVEFTEVSNWYNKILSHFDERIAPDLQYLNVPYNGRTVVALYFETDRRPFVIKNPCGGPISFEVPWRSGNSTKSAKRSDLIKILTPLYKNPKFELLKGELWFTHIGPSEKEEYAWNLKLELYVTALTNDPIIIPFHKCSAELKPVNLSSSIYIEKINIYPPSTIPLRHAETPAGSLTIESTVNEVIIQNAGLLYFKGNLHIDQNIEEIYDEILMKVSILPSRSELPVVIQSVMQHIEVRDKTSKAIKWVSNLYSRRGNASAITDNRSH